MSKSQRKLKRWILVIVTILIFIGLIVFASAKLYPKVNYAPGSPHKENLYSITQISQSLG